VLDAHDAVVRSEVAGHETRSLYHLMSFIACTMHSEELIDRLVTRYWTRRTNTTSIDGLSCLELELERQKSKGLYSLLSCKNKKRQIFLLFLLFSRLRAEKSSTPCLDYVQYSSP
jgi:hypothetical protein